MAIYQFVSILAYIAALWWSLRSRDPLFLGAFLGGTLLFGFDWLWCGRSFFNATFASNLMMIPGLHIQGQTYPIAVACNWGVGFGFAPFLLARAHPWLSRHLGNWHYVVALLFGGIVDIVMETLLVTGLGVYTYHQAPAYMIWGVPWSGVWFGANALALSYFGLAYAKKWAALPPRPGFALDSQNTWKGLIMAASPLWSAFFVTTVVQLFWYSAANPWVESGRAF